MTEKEMKLPNGNPHRSEDRVRQLDADDLGVSTPVEASNGGTSVWDDLHDALDSLETEGVRVAVATENATIATGVNIQTESSRPIHAIELAVWKAYSESRSQLTSILVQSSDEFSPCGRCLEVIRDFSDESVLRIQDPSSDSFVEATINQEPILDTSKSSGNQDEQQEGDSDQIETEKGESESLSIPETAPFIDIEVDDNVEVEYVRLNAPVYHLKYDTHEQTFCGTDLTNRDTVTSTEKPVLLDPCKRCHGETNVETVEEQRLQLRSELSEKVEPIKRTDENPESFQEEEVAALISNVPVESPTGGERAIDLRNRLSKMVVDIHDDQKAPLTFSRTEMDTLLTALDGEKVIPSEPYLFVHTSHGRIARILQSNLTLQRRAGRGEISLDLLDSEKPVESFVLDPREQLYLFTNLGQIYEIPVHRVPAIEQGDSPEEISNIINFGENESLQAAISCDDIENNEYVILGSKRGYIKRTATEEFENIRSTGIKAIKLEGEDEIREVALMNRDKDVLMTTKSGRTIRFSGTDVRPMGRTARGVKGVELDKGDEVVGVNVVNPEDNPEILTVTANGYGKRTELAEYRRQTRNGRGLVDITTGERNGPVVEVEVTSSKNKFVTLSESGRTIYSNVDEIAVVSRNTKGVEIMDLELGDKVAALSIFDS